MRYEDVAIPAGLAWSSPFVKWQGSLAEVSSLDLAADVTSRALAARRVDPGQLTGLVLGWTIPQPGIFYGAPTLAGRIGAPGVSGPMVSQACATSVAALRAAAGLVAGAADEWLVVAADRTSNGPQLAYPAPSRPGGAPLAEHWVTDSFARDPWAGTGPGAPAVRDACLRALGILNSGRGSSQRIMRLLVMDEPPSLDGGEITDKGYVNQRAVLERRADLVARLYADDPPGDVICWQQGAAG